MSTSTHTKVKLMSSDNEMFEVDRLIACESQTVKNMIDEVGFDDAIPLSNISGATLAKVIEYCTYHVESQMSTETKPAVPEDEMSRWDAEFVKLDQFTLIDIILAANYLNIQKLVDAACEGVANMMIGKNPQEIRQIFNVKNDFSPAEEEKVKRENGWAFE